MEPRFQVRPTISKSLRQLGQSFKFILEALVSVFNSVSASEHTFCTVDGSTKMSAINDLGVSTDHNEVV